MESSFRKVTMVIAARPEDDFETEMVAQQIVIEVPSSLSIEQVVESMAKSIVMASKDATEKYQKMDEVLSMLKEMSL